MSDITITAKVRKNGSSFVFTLPKGLFDSGLLVNQKMYQITLKEVSA